MANLAHTATLDFARLLSSGKTHFWIFRGFSWIFVDFLDFLDFLDFNSVIQTYGFSAGLSADLDFNPAKVSSTGF